VAVESIASVQVTGEVQTPASERYMAAAWRVDRREKQKRPLGRQMLPLDEWDAGPGLQCHRGGAERMRESACFVLFFIL
jgi:hypothetical protein